MPANRRARGGHADDDAYERVYGEQYEPGGPEGADHRDEDDPRGRRQDRGFVRDRGAGRHPGRASAPRELTAATAGRAALRHIDDLTGKDVEGVTLVKPAGEGWTVEVEVVEDHRVPSSGDTLAIYAVDLDSEGDLVSYRRVRSYRRARGDTGGVY